MERRKFISGAAAGRATGAALAASFPKPALADSLPEIKWRLASSFPKNLDTIYGAVDEMCRSIAAATEATGSARRHCSRPRRSARSRRTAAMTSSR